jgi:hypothetical protein
MYDHVEHGLDFNENIIDFLTCLDVVNNSVGQLMMNAFLDGHPGISRSMLKHHSLSIHILLRISLLISLSFRMVDERAFQFHLVQNPPMKP